MVNPLKLIAFLIAAFCLYTAIDAGAPRLSIFFGIVALYLFPVSLKKK